MMGKHWLSLTTVPLSFAVIFSPSDYAKQMKEIDCADPPSFILEGAAATMHTLYRKNEFDMCIICYDALSPDNKKRNRTSVYALLVHECVHVLQAVKEAMNEKTAGKEMEAYFVQSLSQFCFHEYHGFMKKKQRRLPPL